MYGFPVCEPHVQQLSVLTQGTESTILSREIEIYSQKILYKNEFFSDFWPERIEVFETHFL